MNPALPALALATLASEDLACLAAGLLVARGEAGFLPAAAACALGIFLGDFLLYLGGRHVGRPALARAPLRWWIDAAAVARGERWFRARGVAALTAARFLPGTRLPTYLAAGALGEPPGRFAAWTALAAALWTPLLVGTGVLFGDAALAAYERSGRWLAVPALVLLAGIALLRCTLPLATWRGRRLALGRWRRLTRWEYWPAWALYPPVLAEIARLALRHRSLRVVACANPGMPGGGILGESKGAILERIAGEDPRVAVTRRLPAASPPAAVRGAMAGAGLTFPVVLKPDIGERGGGVAIVRDDASLGRWCAEHRGEALLQEYVPGVEAGLFYIRGPRDCRGELFAITEKRQPVVIGDGVRTLETLILADPRAVCVAAQLFRQHADRLTDVPAPGERVTLVELGTHARGATFYDGEHLRTRALEEAVERVSGRDPGFCFGRYDVRAESWTALQEGRFTVIELNGVTSEATSIYDPAHRLADAVGILRRQWRRCFEVAAANRALGAALPSWRELLTLWRRHRRAVAGHAAT